MMAINVRCVIQCKRHLYNTAMLKKVSFGLNSKHNLIQGKPNMCLCLQNESRYMPKSIYILYTHIYIHIYDRVLMHLSDYF